jgi:hypothetical protein
MTTSQEAPAERATPAVEPRPSDARVLATLPGVVSVHSNTTSWWNNASFALPLLGALVSTVAGLVLGSAEALGFGGFLGVVTLIMFPVVRLTWRRTPTAVVTTEDRVVALHDGRVLTEIAWADLARIERADYDNIKWRLRPRAGNHLSIEAELEDVDGLIAHASELSGLTPE